VELAGRPLIAHALARVAAAPSVATVVVVCAEARQEAVRAIARDLGIADLRCVAGGARRRDSVAAGLAAAGDADLVVVHDAARPMVSPALIEAVIAATRLHRAATAAVACVDTIKRVEDGLVVETLPRDHLVAVQTPQGFATELLRRAHAVAPEEDASDDCLLVERLGEPVAVVPGEPSNRKVTHLEDLEWLGRQLTATGAR
jgi:2-C-methyl-D-erythritol 4-phosphate cytidylyltransferase